MTDPFTDVADELLTRSTDMGSDFPAVAGAGAKTKKHVCPYCGAVTAVNERPTGPCPRCSMDDTPATRAATKSRIGPWYVLQSRNPSAPGMKWATLLSLVAKGQVTPRSVVRGPTTHQLWKFAAHVKGLSRELNLCYSCGGEIEKTANQCPHCDRLQEPPVNPDTLLETRDMAAATPGPRAPIQREIRTAPTPMPSMGAPTDVVLSGPPPAAEETRRPMRNPDDGILSAKELAAAFQLDFNPQVQPDVPAQQAARPPRRTSKAFVVLILLAAIGAGAAFYMKPEYRSKATIWLNDAFASSKHYLSTASQKKPADSTANKSATPWEQPKAADSTAAAPSAAATVGPTPASTVTPAAPSPSDVSANTSAQTTSESPVQPPVVTSAPNPATPVVNTPPDHPAVDTTAQASATPPPTATPAQPVVQNPPAAPAAPAAPPSQAEQNNKTLVSAEQALKDDQVKLQSALDTANPGSLAIDQQKSMEITLYNGGINAEAAGDSVLAVKCYKKIEELDATVRHTDVDLRLKFLEPQLPH